MATRKKDTSPKDNVQTSSDSPKMLSMEELKIISDMVMASLRDDLTKIMNVDDANNEEDSFYDASELSELNSFPAHKAEERFQAVNDPSECPMCGSKIQKFGHYHLEFGSNIRKRAAFCGIDCLQQFINELSYSKGF